MIAFFVGALVGALITAFVFSLAERAAYVFLDLVGHVTRPVIPLYFWARFAGQMNSARMINRDGQPVHVVTEGREWVAVMRRGGYRLSPAMLLPICVIRVLVWVFGRPVKLKPVGADDAANQGAIFRGLTVAPGLAVCRRRRQDLAYLKTHGRYPAVSVD